MYIVKLINNDFSSNKIQINMFIIKNNYILPEMSSRLISAWNIFPITDGHPSKQFWYSLNLDIQSHVLGPSIPKLIKNFILF